ncbi:hypothetical protein E2562_007304 [Oryza meyeriana var. granulata]|uniref:Uncharacterized protein n=1 Tax=Oryza meyeriana var. granulata TaxID=110450 RepID=A0A6G1CZD2_9ORYZ|nr:hypothetical protein E2562_007304 [Oryza meyeriana var. granulata]
MLGILVIIGLAVAIYTGAPLLPQPWSRRPSLSSMPPRQGVPLSSPSHVGYADSRPSCRTPPFAAVPLA